MVRRRRRDAWGIGDVEGTDPAAGGEHDGGGLTREDGPLAALDGLIGLDNVKHQVRTLVNLTSSHSGAPNSACPHRR